MRVYHWFRYICYYGSIQYVYINWVGAMKTSVRARSSYISYGLYSQTLRVFRIRRHRVVKNYGWNSSWGHIQAISGSGCWIFVCVVVKITLTVLGKLLDPSLVNQTCAGYQRQIFNSVRSLRVVSLKQCSSLWYNYSTLRPRALPSMIFSYCSTWRVIQVVSSQI